jgi:hypothetical protein
LISNLNPETQMKLLLFLLILAAIVAIVAASAAAVIWALNTIFLLGIAFTAKNILAIVVLTSVFSSGAISRRKS